MVKKEKEKKNMQETRNKSKFPQLDKEHLVKTTANVIFNEKNIY